MGDDETSCVNLQKSYLADNAELKKRLATSEEKLSDAEGRIQGLEHNKDALGRSATQVDEAESKLSIFE